MFRRSKVTAKHHDSKGIMTAEVLQRPLDDDDVYLCGPPSFMQGIYRILRILGVAKHGIAYELFGPSTVLNVDYSSDAGSAAPPLQTAAVPAPAITVEFRKSRRSVVWEETTSLLDFAEQHGLSPEFSCRAGICGSCKVALLQGEVSYFQEPLDTPEADSVLICSCKPSGSIVLDL